MKRYVYAVCFSLVALIGLNACSKSSDPVAASPVVGRWELNRALMSGFPAATNANGQALDLYLVESYGSTIDIYADNTFNENYKSITVNDAAGTWDLSNSTLNLKYDLGSQDTYTYSKNKNIEELTASAPLSYTLQTSTTTTAVGQIQLIYRK